MTDYPDYVIPLARTQWPKARLRARNHRYAVSGVGASVWARCKIPGVRAGLVSDHFSARQGVEDDHMNVICMGGRSIGSFVAWDILEGFLAAQYVVKPHATYAAPG